MPPDTIYPHPAKALLYLLYNEAVLSTRPPLGKVAARYRILASAKAPLYNEAMLLTNHPRQHWPQPIPHIRIRKSAFICLYIMKLCF